MTLPHSVRGHLLGLLVVSFVLVAGMIAVRTTDVLAHRHQTEGLQRYLTLPDLDFGDPAERELFRETMQLYHPGEHGRIDSLVADLTSRYQQQFANRAEKTGTDLTGLTFEKGKQLAGMFVQFLIIYAIVMILVAMAGERAGIALFIRREQQRERASHRVPRRWRDRWSDVLLILITFLAFTPAYVVAYAMKTRIDTGNVLFLLLLGVASNGVLATSTRRFYTLLVTESRKGYVENARVHGLRESYAWDKAHGISHRAVWAPLRYSHGHIFHHIAANAQFQSLLALKEQASFVITGLVIIEMALNLQGRLCYELLQNMLYHQYDVVLAIILGIFWIVKGTEIAIDFRYDREVRRYANR